MALFKSASLSRSGLISGLAFAVIAQSPLINTNIAHAEEEPADSGLVAGSGLVIEPWGYPLDAFDHEVRPQDDFYRFANGGWLDDNDIPGDRSGIGFSITMRERNEARMTAIIDGLKAERPRRGSDGQKIRDLYLGFMDQARIEMLDLKPFAKDLNRIASLVTHDDIARAMADPVLGLNSPFAVFVAIDSKNPNSYAVWATHAGLSMPDRSYYLRDSERLETTREAFRDYVYNALLLSLDGGTLEETASSDALHMRAAAVFDLEKAIATLHWTRAERRNASRTYNLMPLSALETFAPDFPWASYASTLELDDDISIIVREKEAFPGLAALFAETPVGVWKDYLYIHYISGNAQFMPQRYNALRFDFFNKAISGQKEQRPRSKRALAVVDGQLNQAIGKIYIERYFPEDSKVQMTQMFENIRTAFKTRIEGLSWMTPETKKQALFKLENVTAKIAYPEKWRDYSSVRVKRNDLFGNIKRFRLDGFRRDINRLGQPVDKKEWFSGPQTVNAFYSPTRNEAFIPAGYIQSPLFDPNADPALNYGAIGSIIGHEIGHGFDDQGSKYDARGVLQSWWTDQDRAAFDALGDRLVAQFDQYEPLPGLSVNGRQTLGENIGDLAGMTVAYHAYILSLNGAEPPVLDGFTGKQRFFLGRAQGRRYKRTEQSLRRRLLSAPHSPMYLRVNGMIRNMDEWYDAFGVVEGDGLYIPPEQRVRIW